VGNKRGNEKGIETLAPLLLMMQQQKPNPLESLMQMFMISKLIDQMMQKEDDLTKAFKFKMMMQMIEGSKKESNIDDYIKLLQILNPSNANEIEKLQK
jgi:hypothetical protein